MTESTGPEQETTEAPATEQPAINPDDYSKAELEEMAEAKGIDHAGMTKAEIAAAIDAAGGPPTPEELILSEEQAKRDEEAATFNPYEVEGTAEYEDRQEQEKQKAAMDQAIADGTVEPPPGYVAPEPEG